MTAIERAEDLLKAATVELPLTATRDADVRPRRDAAIWAIHAKDSAFLRGYIGAVRALERLQQQVNAQAEDAGLWFITDDIATAYVQQELRSLHSTVEAQHEAIADFERLFPEEPQEQSSPLADCKICSRVLPGVIYVGDDKSWSFMRCPNGCVTPPNKSWGSYAVPAYTKDAFQALIDSRI